MCDVIRHRGPDGEGFALIDHAAVWRLSGPDTPADVRKTETADDATAGTRPARIALGHRRLSILDTSAAGHQPMPSADGRIWVTYNGEIYNFVELRVELAALGHAFSTGTDTEVLIAAYRQWGEACLSRFNGMFAFVLVDRQAGRLLAARDRFGVKPLYLWTAPDGVIALVSEIKQLTVLPGWRARLDGQAAADYLVWGLTDHGGASLFADVRPVPAGHIVDLDLAAARPRPAMRKWYALPPDGLIDGDDHEIERRWREAFMDAVRVRLRSDVPVGTALSGGLDSSSIVCAVDALSAGSPNARRNAFSARAHDPRFDEGTFMDAVVERTGVLHHCVWPEPEDLISRLGDLAWHMDEPFGSTSVFAEWKVFETVATTDVKVTLDGHGGDEILAGYRDFAGPLLGQLLRNGQIRSFVREVQALRRRGNVGPAQIAALLVDDVAPGAVRHALRRWAGRTTPAPDWLDLRRLGAEPRDPFRVAIGIGGLSRAQISAISLPMQLRWNDRNSMAHSIESRAPFLDVRLVELTLQLHLRFKLADGVSKVILRRALADLLPPAIASRRDKMGFVTPEESWMRGPMAATFRAAAMRALERGSEWFTPPARAMIDDIAAGRRHDGTQYWRMISFGAWLDRFEVTA